MNLQIANHWQSSQQAITLIPEGIQGRNPATSGMEVNSTSDAADSPMRYLGSKVATADAIVKVVSSHVASGSFCDPFGGVGVVGARFKEHGYRVTSGDVLRNAYNFQVARIERNRLPSFSRLRASCGLQGSRDVNRQLNQAVEYGGWFKTAAGRKFLSIPLHTLSIVRPMASGRSKLGERATHGF